MRKPIGKCKTCFGCNMLSERGFKGRKKCKNYIRANENEHIAIIIIAIVELLMFLALGFYAYFRINMVYGG